MLASLANSPALFRVFVSLAKSSLVVGFFVSAILWTSPISAQQINPKKVRFTHLTTKDGLSNNSIICFLHDSRGYMWIGTSDGLNRYDGYGAKVYRKTPDDPHSLGNNFINLLFEDHQKNVWVGTIGNGLYKYDDLQDNFIGYPELSGATIRSMAQDPEGSLWVGTDTDPKTGLSLYSFDQKQQKFIGFDQFKTKYGLNPILTWGKDELWLGVQRDGLWKINTKTGKVLKQYRHAPESPNSLCNNDVATLVKSKSGKIWLGTFANGVNEFDPVSEQFAHFKHIPGDSTSISSPSIRHIAEDAEGNIWVGSYHNIWVMNPQTRVHYVLYHNKLDQGTISGNAISALYTDKIGRVWVGMEQKGVSVWDQLRYKFEDMPIGGQYQGIGDIHIDRQNRFWASPYRGLYMVKDGKTTIFTHQANNPHGLGSQSIISMSDDAFGRMWLGTWEGGITMYDEKKEKFVHFRPNPSDPNSLSDNRIYDILSDCDPNKLWIATVGYGVNMLDITTQKFRRFTHDPHNPLSLSSEATSTLCQDKKGNIWIGTARGLNLYLADKGGFVRYEHQGNDPQSLSSNMINDILEDKEGVLWIGTHEGLNKMTKEGKFVRFTLQDGLPNQVIVRIAEDENGLLWLATKGGIVRFDKKAKFTLFDESNGLLNNEIHDMVKDKSGKMYLSTSNGVNVFFPNKINDNPHLPPVYLADLKLFNKSVAVGEHDSLLSRPIAHTQAITLTHEQSVFSLGFVALNLTQPEKNQYAYRLEGFDKDWNHVGNKREATYTNLDPGIYTFRVKASNNDGVWNEEGASIAITILPPWWETWWFRLLAILATVGGAAAFYLRRMQVVEAQKRILEQRVLERTKEIAQKSQELELAHHEVKAKNEELQASEEELRQNMEELEANQEFIQQQKQSLEAAYQLLSAQNAKVSDSIRYAQRIQQTILPSPELLADAFAEHFVIFKPKDVVSGDFYWFAEVDGTQFLAVVDCTGHGVPGAFMSMIGSSLLQEITGTRRLSEPAEILRVLHQEVLHALYKKDGEMRDGMDIGLCAIRRIDSGAWVGFSGAKRPLHYFSGGQLHEVRADRMAIGQAEDFGAFSTHELLLAPGDTLYLTTDGWTDAINPGREKFGLARFRQMLAEGAYLPLATQQAVFSQALEDHESGAPQRDDVLLVGVRV